MNKLSSAGQQLYGMEARRRREWARTIQHTERDRASIFMDEAPVQPEGEIANGKTCPDTGRSPRAPGR